MRLKKSLGMTLALQLAIPVAVSFVTSTSALSQGLRSENMPQLPKDSYDLAESQGLHSSLLFGPLKAQTLDEAYRPITHSQRLRWFVSSTIGPAHLAGVAFVSGCGTAVNRPREYGPHWEGLADRFGTGMAGGPTSNAMEAGAGLFLREDPRYFRVPQQTFKSRAANVARLTFLARNESGKSEPAFARYIGVIGGNFVSNSWRVHSEANTKDALLRSSEGFAGRMAANAFAEFWPDVKRHAFRKNNRAPGRQTLQ